ncbi:MAG: DUF934 domain-containing protein [Parvibaculum sp.]|jgi:uncharacterized protein (DUF934 family)|uniref:DUF934 domain-containing protein n=1 Tax=Parvibaculum sp. TaxID=2024848 RepID=UPI00284AF63A|nr:DUF934 domain-containing protein [Parvibaculum sp.]MDR3497766.1 DUF934 domain-containing protein [Parvibaculum sp.]
MQLIKNGAFIADVWTHVADEDELPDGPAIVSLQRWQKEQNALVARGKPLGIRLKSGEAPSLIAADLDKFDVVALEFPAYRNGRAYSYARLLRERYGYKGEVRAVGAVLRDQFYFLVRVGFDALEVRDNITPEIWKESVGVFTNDYQPSSDGKPSVMSLRHRLAAHASARNAG